MVVFYANYLSCFLNDLYIGTKTIIPDAIIAKIVCQLISLLPFMAK